MGRRTDEEELIHDDIKSIEIAERILEEVSEKQIPVHVLIISLARILTFLFDRLPETEDEFHDVVDVLRENLNNEE